MLLPRLTVPPSEPSGTTTYLGPWLRGSLVLAGAGADPPLQATDTARAPSPRAPNSHFTSRLIGPPPGPAALHVVEARERGATEPGGAVSFLNEDCHGIQVDARSQRRRRRLRAMTTVRLISEERTNPRRVRLLETPIALVEDVHAELAGGWVGAEGFSPEFQLALPYQGLFVWEVGHDSVVGDANQVLFIAGGEAFRMRSPLPGGYGELIITPGEPLLDEITGGRGSIARVHPLFRRRSRRIEPALQLARARFLARARQGGETLEAEEHMVWL